MGGRWMSGANIGTAYMTVSPKFDGLGSAVESAFSKVDGSSAGARVGDSFSSGVGKGLASSGAIIGAFSAVTSKAMDIISSSIGGAIERFDTLKIYPRVMQTLGYSAEDAQSSIEKMADHLTGLP